MKKIISILLIVTTLCLSLIGCGKNIATNDDGKVELTFVLDWTPNTNHTGIYVADKLGYFEDAGLSLKIVQPPDDGATTMVSSGDAQFGVDFQDSLAGAFSLSQPMPVTAVAAILQHNTSGIISLKENGINSPSKMENFNYATWGLPIEQETLRKVIEMDGEIGRASCRERVLRLV